MTERRPNAVAVPALLALGLALAAAVIHTRVTFRYFSPLGDELLSAFLPWGPLLVPEWPKHAGRAALAGLFFLSLPGLGAQALRRVKGEPAADDFFAQTGAALVLWSLGGFFLAAAGLSRPLWLKAASLLLAGFGLASWRRASWPKGAALRHLTRSPLCWGFLAFVFLYGLTTLVPDTFYDAAVYHLAVPQAYLQTGRMADLPDVYLSRLPGLIQTLYLWALAWSDDRLCKLLNLGFGLLLAAGAGAWVGRRWSAKAGLWAALLIVSSPLVGVNLWSCTNDLLCGFLFFTGFALWVEAWRQEARFDGPALALSGFFLGAAAAAKGTALFGLPFFGLDLLVRLRQDPKRTAPAAGLFAAGLLLPLLPWWIRTGLWTGNPFYPQAAAWLGGDAPEAVALLRGWASEARGEGTLLYRSLSLVRDSLQGVEGGRFGFLGPALLMLLPLTLFLRFDNASRSLLACGLVSYVFFVFATGRLRYFLPQLSLFFALGAASLWDYEETASRLSRHPAPPFSAFLGRAARRAGPWFRGLLALTTLLNGLWLVLIFQRFNQGWDVVWGRQSARDYLRQEHIGVYGHPSQGAFDFLADQKAEGKVFVVGEARTYRCPLPARASASFNVPTYARWLEENPRPGGFVERLRREGYTYLLLNAPEMRRVTPGAYTGDEYLRPLGMVLDALAPPAYRDRWTVLFRISSTQAATP